MIARHIGNFTRHQFIYLAAVVVPIFLLALSVHGAWSQVTRTIKIIVPASPGGLNDILARLLGEQVARMNGIAVVIENRPGAGTVIGTESAARAAPDGNTLLVEATPFLINPQIRRLNYDPLTSFEPICRLVSSPTLIVVNSTSPYRTLAALIDAARAMPNTVTMASVGPGSPYQIGFEMLKRAAKVEMTFVPYPGNAPAVSALLGDHVTSMFGTYSDVAEYVKAGKLRPLATGARSRIQWLPELPTVAELGYKGYEVDSWFGVYAPANTPKETLSKLADWFAAALQAPEVRTKLLAQGLYPVGTCGSDFAVYLREQYEEYGRIIREANIRAE
jgi:tripartite-type tricarboxylate transporter receptor subunit TctC